MRLPEMRYADGRRKMQTLAFGGYNRARGAGDGEICEVML